MIGIRRWDLQRERRGEGVFRIGPDIRIVAERLISESSRKTTMDKQAVNPRKKRNKRNQTKND